MRVLFVTGRSSCGLLPFVIRRQGQMCIRGSPWAAAESAVHTVRGVDAEETEKSEEQSGR